MSAETAFQTVNTVTLLVIVTYLSVIITLNTSMGLRMGYGMWRIMPASLVWPLLFVYEPLDEWAKNGSCTLPETHPLRQ